MTRYYLIPTTWHELGQGKPTTGSSSVKELSYNMASGTLEKLLSAKKIHLNYILFVFLHSCVLCTTHPTQIVHTVYQCVFITLWLHSPEERSPQMAQMCLVSDRAVPEGWAGTFITPLRPRGGLMSSVLLTEFIGEFSWNVNTQTHTATVTKLNHELITSHTATAQGGHIV